MHDGNCPTRRQEYKELPLVYSCSGCSNAAQLANTLAVRLDREGLAEMSCIAGVGGNVKSLVKKATSGRPVVVLDGCALNCARKCLERHGVTPVLHIDLSAHGVKKRYHEDASVVETWRVWRETVLPAVAALPVE
ncbi:MAG TPA: putative zinc-binding protein [Gammaproteobacteria bacterium]|nr:putative zinc-binding protein [Gammaproteobacteria bacterium]